MIPGSVTNSHLKVYREAGITSTGFSVTLPDKRPIARCPPFFYHKSPVKRRSRPSGPFAKEADRFTPRTIHQGDA